MCLDISRTYHRAYAKPKVATFPILTYKGLDKGWNDNTASYSRLVSPYRGTEYKFGQLYTSNLRRWELEVEQGLHSCITREQASFHGELAFPSVIPVGSQYYLGQRNDVVSTQLIVFSSIKAVEKHFGVAIAPAVKRNTL